MFARRWRMQADARQEWPGQAFRKSIAFRHGEIPERHGCIGSTVARMRQSTEPRPGARVKPQTHAPTDSR